MRAAGIIILKRLLHISCTLSVGGVEITFKVIHIAVVVHIDVDVGAIGGAAVFAGAAGQRVKIGRKTRAVKNGR